MLIALDKVPPPSFSGSMPSTQNSISFVVSFNPFQNFSAVARDTGMEGFRGSTPSSITWGWDCERLVSSVRSSVSCTAEPGKREARDSSGGTLSIETANYVGM
jgi:hypothetical protein